MTIPKQHIIFDLDGTIIDSKPEIIETFKKVLHKIKPEITFDLESLDFGANLVKLLNFIYSNNTEKVNEAKQLYSDIYDRSNFEQTLLFAKVESVLKALNSKNIAMYIATNKRYIPTMRILKQKRINHFFIDVQAQEMQENTIITKPEMIKILITKFNIPNYAFMVGDTVGDITSGQANQLQTIAVTYGYQLANELEVAKPTYTINQFEEILNLI